MKNMSYQEVITPEVFNVELYKTSGHYEHFADNMFFADPGEEADISSESEKEETGYAIKPMNCPGHCLLFGMQRQYPIKIYL